MIENHYSVPQASKKLGTSQRTIRRWIDLRFLKATKIGRTWRIPESELARLLKEKPPQ